MGVGYAPVVVAVAVGIQKETAIGGRYGVTGCNPISWLKVIMVANTGELYSIQYTTGYSMVRLTLRTDRWAVVALLGNRYVVRIRWLSREEAAPRVHLRDMLNGSQLV